MLCRLLETSEYPAVMPDFIEEALDDQEIPVSPGVSRMEARVGHEEQPYQRPLGIGQ